MILEVALSLTLLAGAALLIESLFRLRAEPMGYRMDGLLTARLELPKTAYPALADRLLFCDRLTQSLAALPGLEATVRSERLAHAEVAGEQRGARLASYPGTWSFPNTFGSRVCRSSPAASSPSGMPPAANPWPSWTGNSRAATSRAGIRLASTSGSANRQDLALAHRGRRGRRHQRNQSLR